MDQGNATVKRLVFRGKVHNLRKVFKVQNDEFFIYKKYESERLFYR